MSAFRGFRPFLALTRGLTLGLWPRSFGRSSAEITRGCAGGVIERTARNRTIGRFDAAPRHRPRDGLKGDAQTLFLHRVDVKVERVDG